jgi:hypothetical protein
VRVKEELGPTPQRVLSPAIVSAGHATAVTNNVAAALVDMSGGVVDAASPSTSALARHRTDGVSLSASVRHGGSGGSGGSGGADVAVDVALATGTPRSVRRKRPTSSDGAAPVNGDAAGVRGPVAVAVAVADADSPSRATGPRKRLRVDGATCCHCMRVDCCCHDELTPADTTGGCGQSGDAAAVGVAVVLPEVAVLPPAASPLPPAAAADAPWQQQQQQQQQQCTVPPLIEAGTLPPSGGDSDR